MTSPIRAAASAPASVAAFTAATSPSTKAVTSPAPTVCQPANDTLADLSMASVASNSATSPFVSIIPSACFIASSLFGVLLEKLDVFGQVQTARVGFVGVHVDVELAPIVDSYMNVVEGQARGAADTQFHL